MLNQLLHDIGETLTIVDQNGIDGSALDVMDLWFNEPATISEMELPDAVRIAIAHNILVDMHRHVRGCIDDGLDADDDENTPVIFDTLDALWKEFCGVFQPLIAYRHSIGGRNTLSSGQPGSNTDEAGDGR